MNKLNSKKCIYVIAIVAAFAVSGFAQDKPAKSEKSDAECPMMAKDKDKSEMTDVMAKDKDMSAMGDSMDMSKHKGHTEMVMENGEKAMGFSQTATTHHFLIMSDGGAIQVEANDAKNTVDRDKIRMHLTEIAKQFKNGIFTTPFAVHGQVPPGVPEMDKLKDSIQYTYEQTEKGARVRISTKNAEALAAIHSFLKFQIEEHMTGDPMSE